MYKFLKDCYFKECYEGRKFVSLVYRLRALPCIAQSRLRTMPHSAESTHIHKYLREIETKLKNILGH
jgi:hypothetical protein